MRGEDLASKVLDVYWSRRKTNIQMPATYAALLETVEGCEKIGDRQASLNVLDKVLGRIAIRFPSELRAKAFLLRAQLSPDFRAAENFYLRSIASNPLPEVYTELANLYFEKHDRTQAPVYLAKAREAEAKASRLRVQTPAYGVVAVS